jgi:hypothetical protein
LHLPSTPRRRSWIVVRDDGAEAANEARATAAITVGIENQSDPEETVENETGTGTLVQERAETENVMIDGVMILGIVITSVVEIAENETTGVDDPVRIVHVPVLEKDGEQAIVHAVVVERGETVPVVATGYVLQVLLQETLSSRNGS